MRLLVTTDVAGGVWSYTEELVDALLERGHEVALVSLGGSPREMHREWLAAHPELDFTTVEAPLEWVPEPEPGLSASRDDLRRVIDRTAPEVIHLNQFYYGAFDLGAPTLVVAHSDVVSWWHAVLGEAPPVDAWFERYRGWVREGLHGADRRVAPAGWIARRMEEIYDVPVQVIHNARSPERFRPVPGPRERSVVAAGRLWDEAKGARDLIPAARALRGVGRVVVAGSTKHPAGGEDFPEDAPGVEWRGILSAEALRALLGRSAVYAATSRYEPFGLAPLEAALCGCALVMSDIPTFRELWEGCALFYPPGDAPALAGAARELLEDDDRRERLARAAGERARTRYSPERMAKEYEALYLEMQGPTTEPDEAA